MKFVADNALSWMLVLTGSIHSHRHSALYLSHLRKARPPTFVSCISVLACRFCAHSLVYIYPAFVFAASRSIARSHMMSLESGSNDDELGDELKSA